jgi:transposase
MPHFRLPPAGLTRWTAQSKAAVVVAIRGGALGRSEAAERYMLSEEELSQWEKDFDQGGIAGLQMKSRLLSHRRRRHKVS